MGFAPHEVHDVGNLLARAGTSDVVDAHVVLTADRRDATVLTSDVEDLERLSNRLRRPLDIQRV